MTANRKDVLADAADACHAYLRQEITAEEAIGRVMSFVFALDRLAHPPTADETPQPAPKGPARPRRDHASKLRLLRGERGKP